MLLLASSFETRTLFGFSEFCKAKAEAATVDVLVYQAPFVATEDRQCVALATSTQSLGDPRALGMQ